MSWTVNRTRNAVIVESYRALLDATIDRMLTKQSNSETDEHP
jgi:hypothetical protein